MVTINLADSPLIRGALQLIFTWFVANGCHLHDTVKQAKSICLLVPQKPQKAGVVCCHVRRIQNGKLKENP